jgi:hypothetical protein
MHGNNSYQFCGHGNMYCSFFSELITFVGYVNRDTAVVANISFQDTSPTCIAVDPYDWPWIGAGRGLTHGYQNYDVGLLTKDSQRDIKNKYARLFYGPVFFQAPSYSWISAGGGRAARNSVLKSLFLAPRNRAKNGGD